MYFAFAAIYYVLVLAVIVDVLRQPASALSGVGKAAVDRCLLGHSRDPVACLRLLAHKAIAPVEGAFDADRHQSGDRGADRRARAGRAWRRQTRPSRERRRHFLPGGRCRRPIEAAFFGDSRRWSRRTPRSSLGSSRRTWASRSPEHAARSAWWRRSSTSTPEPSTSTAARRSPWPAESLPRSASRSASSGSSSRGTSRRTSPAGSSGRRSHVATRSSSSRPS